MSMLKAVWEAIMRLFVGIPTDAIGLVKVVPATEDMEVQAAKEAPTPEEKTTVKKHRAQRAK